MNLNKDVIILIPSYKPNEELIKLVKELSPQNKILVINDGTKDKRIFCEIEKNCTIIEHEQNMGKGQALKTGFEYILKNYKNIVGVVTADDDGQHKAKDIEKVKKKLLENEKKLVLGYRNLKCKQMPFRSKIGNVTINFLFRIITGTNIKDTQTGLRGIPLDCLQQIINVYGKRFEYEMNYLILLVKKFEFVEVNIDTIYDKNNKTTYRMIRDSVLILQNIINIVK